MNVHVRERRITVLYGNDEVTFCALQQQSEIEELFRDLYDSGAAQEWLNTPTPEHFKLLFRVHNVVSCDGMRTRSRVDISGTSKTEVSIGEDGVVILQNVHYRGFGDVKTSWTPCRVITIKPSQVQVYLDDRV